MKLLVKIYYHYSSVGVVVIIFFVPLIVLEFIKMKPIKKVYSIDELKSLGFVNSNICRYIWLNPETKQVYTTIRNKFITGTSYLDPDTKEWITIPKLFKELEYKDLDLSKFVEVPGYTNYLINKDGQVFSKKYHLLMETTINKNGYVTIPLVSDTGERYTKFMHHLLLATFRPEEYARITKLEHIAGCYIRYVVNHKDGNKQNNDLDNLEVVTQSENGYHAVKNNLISTPKKVMIKFHNEDGLIRKFDSMIEASIYMGYHDTTIGQRLDHENYAKIMWPDDTQVKYADDPDFEKPTIYVKKGGGIVHPIVAIDYKTNQFVEKTYRSLTDYYKATGINISSLKKMLEKTNQPILSNLQRIKRIEDLSEWKTPDRFDPIYELATTWSSRTYVLINKDGISPPIVILPDPRIKLSLIDELKHQSRDNLRRLINGDVYYTDSYLVFEYTTFVRTEYYKKWEGRYSEYHYLGFNYPK